VDPCWNIHFVARTGTCDLKCVIPVKQLTKVGRTCAKHSLYRSRKLHGISKGDAVKFEDVVPNRSLLGGGDSCQQFNAVPKDFQRTTAAPR
jgi:hypothetical protein